MSACSYRVFCEAVLSKHLANIVRNMLHISTILSFSLLLIPLAFSKTEFTVTLDSQDKFNVTWSYDGKSKDDYITFTVSSGENIYLFIHDLCSKGTAWITVWWCHQRRDGCGTF